MSWQKKPVVVPQPQERPVEAVPELHLVPKLSEHLDLVECAQLVEQPADGPPAAVQQALDTPPADPRKTVDFTDLRLSVIQEGEEWVVTELNWKLTIRAARPEAAIIKIWATILELSTYLMRGNVKTPAN